MTRAVGDVLIIAAAVPAVLSAIQYACLPWRRAALGPHLMVYMLVMGVVLALAVARIFIGSSPIFDMIRTGVFVGVPVVMWWRWWYVHTAWLEWWRDRRAERRRGR